MLTSAQKHINFISNPSQWPNLVLPLKRDIGNQRMIAVLVPTFDNHYRLYRGVNLWKMDMDAIDWNTGYETFPTAASIVQAGWLVD